VSTAQAGKKRGLTFVQECGRRRRRDETSSRLLGRTGREAREPQLLSGDARAGVNGEGGETLRGGAASLLCEATDWGRRNRGARLVPCCDGGRWGGDRRRYL